MSSLLTDKFTKSAALIAAFTLAGMTMSSMTESAVAGVDNGAAAAKDEKKPTVIEVTKDNYEKEVVDYDGPVLIDFYAVWCGPCKRLAPEVKKFAEGWDKGKVIKVDIDILFGADYKNHPLKKLHDENIRGYPTMILLNKDEKVESTFVGATTEGVIKNWVERSLDDGKKRHPNPAPGL